MIDIFNLAYLRIIRNRKNSLLMFLVLLLSFASAIVSVSVVGSISKTNAEYLLDTYGEWYFAVPYGYKNDVKWLSQMEWVDAVGTSENVGTIAASNITAGIGTIDETFIDIGRIKLDQGVFPSSDNEIAMEADLLSALGYDYTLWQEISVTVMIPLEYDPYFPLMIEKTYTLCGVIHEYSDLWYLSHNENSIPLNSAVISQNAADELISDAKKMLLEEMGTAVRHPILQYFVSVSEENRVPAKDEFNNYLEARMHSGIEGDIQVCVNDVAYMGSSAESSNFYMYIIAILTFISVICLEIIRLPANTYSFSVLRSIGMSKKQLALLQLSEILILGLTAILLGIPIGAGLTWAALRLTLFSGSVPIQVYIPYDMLFFIIALWIAAIILSRLMIFVFTLRVPMVGRFQMNTLRSKYTRVIKSGFIVLLLCIFSECVVYTGLHSLGTVLRTEYASQCPSYRLYGINGSILHSDDINAVKKIPGISDVFGCTELLIGLSFNGRSEEAVYLDLSESRPWSTMPYGMVYLLVINENDWTDTLDFGNENEKAAFHNGDFVFVTVPYDNEKEYLMPEGKANINIYEYETWSDLENNSSDNDNRNLIGGCTVNTRNIILPEWVIGRGLASTDCPYTVICSEQFFCDLLETLPKDQRWGNFVTGGEFGYADVLVMTDLNSDYLSTDIIIAKICKERGIWLTNERQKLNAFIQLGVQYLIMLFFSGTCIGIIALMILISNISLETENEKHSFFIKRCIGMSKRQISINIIGKTVLRCLSAFLLSCIVYILYSFHKTTTLRHELTFLGVIKAMMVDLIYYFQQSNGMFVIILLLGLILPIILILYSKKDLRKEGDINISTSRYL